MQRIIKIILWLPVFCMGCDHRQSDITPMNLRTPYFITWNEQNPHQLQWTCSSESIVMVLAIYSQRDQTTLLHLDHYKVGSDLTCCRCIATLVNGITRGSNKLNFRIAPYYLSNLLKEGILDWYPDIEILKSKEIYTSVDYEKLENWLNTSFHWKLDIEHMIKITISRHTNQKPSVMAQIKNTNPEEFYSSNEPIISRFKIVTPHEAGNLPFPGIIQFWSKHFLKKLINLQAVLKTGERQTIPSLRNNNQMIVDNLSTLDQFIGRMNGKDIDDKNGYLVYIPFYDLRSWDNDIVWLLLGHIFVSADCNFFLDYFVQFGCTRIFQILDNQNLKHEMRKLIADNPYEAITRVLYAPNICIATRKNGMTIVYSRSVLTQVISMFPYGSFISD